MAVGGTEEAEEILALGCRSRVGVLILGHGV
jgi:hypothetical protein